MLRLQRALPERYIDGDARRARRRGSPRPRRRSGPRVLILGHHYQRDEVMRWADARGDSFGLSRTGRRPPRRRVHRLLRRPLHGRVGRHPHRRPPAGHPPRPERRLLDGRHGRPRLRRGGLGGPGRGHRRRPDRARHLHELLGRPQGVRGPPRRGGVHLVQRPGRADLGPRTRPRTGAGPRGDKVLFFPDQHLGRNTGFQLGWAERRHAGVEPPPRPGRPRRRRRQGGHLPAVEGPLLGPPALPARARRRPSGPSTPTASSSSTPSAPTTWSSWPTRWAPPTSSSGPSTQAPAGSVIGVGTEIHLVKRLDDEHPDKTVVSLDPLVCPCSTMFRIDAAHLCWVLEDLVDGGWSTGSPSTTTPRTWARVALQRMLDIT